MDVHRSSEQPWAEIKVPAVKGTEAVLRAAAKTPSVSTLLAFAHRGA
jgi:hypothetical protein